MVLSNTSVKNYMILTGPIMTRNFHHFLTTSFFVIDVATISKVFELLTPDIVCSGTTHLHRLTMLTHGFLICFLCNDCVNVWPGDIDVPVTYDK